MTLVVTRVSSHCQYGTCHNANGKEITAEYYELTVVAEDVSDKSFKRTAVFHFRSLRALSRAIITASREGTAVVWRCEEGAR